jgi:hypothetical protein
MRGGTESEKKRERLAVMAAKRDKARLDKEILDRAAEGDVLNLLDENLARAESADNKYHVSKAERAANEARMNEEYGKEFQSFKYDANSPYKPAEKPKKKGLLKRLFRRTEKNSPTLPAEQMPPKQPGFTAYYPKKSASKKKSSAEYESIRKTMLAKNEGADINVPSYTSPKATSPKASYISVRSVKKTNKRGPKVAALAAIYEGSKF